METGLVTYFKIKFTGDGPASLHQRLRPTSNVHPHRWGGPTPSTPLAKAQEWVVHSRRVEGLRGVPPSLPPSRAGMGVDLHPYCPSLPRASQWGEGRPTSPSSNEGVVAATCGGKLLASSFFAFWFFFLCFEDSTIFCFSKILYQTNFLLLTPQKTLFQMWPSPKHFSIFTFPQPKTLFRNFTKQIQLFQFSKRVSR